MTAALSYDVQVCSSGANSKNVSGNREQCTSGTNSSGTYTNSYHSSNTKPTSANGGAHSHGEKGCGDKANGNHGCGTSVGAGAAETCTNVAKSNVTKTVWSSATKVQICGSGSFSCGTYSYIVKSNTKTVDITCTLGTKTNG